MSGFDCEFTKKPPEPFQCHCPICLMILREPHQATCCGKSFCRSCIKKVQAKKQPCPTCNEENFNCFQNKGLQLPLYEFKVFCSNKKIGCFWQGELKELDKHVNNDPDKNSQLEGCTYTQVKCLFCSDLYQRQEVKAHQTSKCPKRTFNCEMCSNYKSTYEDVTTNHAPECKCRPAVCPNSCGAKNLQHQHLEEHMSIQCPLTLVECEFSDAGCDAKVHRRDLRSHLSTNMVTHLSLLAKELKAQREKNLQEASHLKNMIEKEKKITQSFFRIQPLTFKCTTSRVAINTEEPFYSHAGGYKLQLETELEPQTEPSMEPPMEQPMRSSMDPPTSQLPLPSSIKGKPRLKPPPSSSYHAPYTSKFAYQSTDYLDIETKHHKKKQPLSSKQEPSSSTFRQQQPIKLKMKYTLLKSEFPVQLPCKLTVTTKIIDQTNNSNHIEVKHTVISEKPAEWDTIDFQEVHHNNYSFIFHVVNVSTA